MIALEELKARRDGLIQQRDEFIAQANREIAYINGKIDALGDILKPDEQTQTQRKEESL
jgi:hypothetical protein